MYWLGRVITLSVIAGSAVLIAFLLAHVAHYDIGLTRPEIRPFGIDRHRHYCDAARGLVCLFSRPCRACFTFALLKGQIACDAD
jgi:hypothetical protein